MHGIVESRSEHQTDGRGSTCFPVKEGVATMTRLAPAPSEASAENAASRLWAGIHFRSACDVGLTHVTAVSGAVRTWSRRWPWARGRS